MRDAVFNDQFLPDQKRLSDGKRARGTTAVSVFGQILLENGSFVLTFASLVAMPTWHSYILKLSGLGSHFGCFQEYLISSGGSQKTVSKRFVDLSCSKYVDLWMGQILSQELFRFGSGGREREQSLGCFFSSVTSLSLGVVICDTLPCGSFLEARNGMILCRSQGEGVSAYAAGLRCRSMPPSVMRRALILELCLIGTEPSARRGRNILQ